MSEPHKLADLISQAESTAHKEARAHPARKSRPFPFRLVFAGEALVIRRGNDGTATVELRWDKNGKRRILFIKGAPKAADVPQAMKFTRNERGWKVTYKADEHFEIPEPLVFGG